MAGSRIRIAVKLALGLWLTCEILGLLCASSEAQEGMPPARRLLLESNESRDEAESFDSPRYELREAPPPAAPNAVQRPARRPVVAPKAAVPKPAPPEALPLSGVPEVAPRPGEGSRGEDRRDEALPEVEIVDSVSILNLETVAGYQRIDAQSNRSERRWTSDGPIFGVRSKVHLLQPVALGFDYTFTRNHDVTASPASEVKVKAEHSWLLASVYWEPVVVSGIPKAAFGISYREYQMVIPKAGVERPGLVTQGLQLAMRIDLPPTRPYYFTHIDFKIAPRQQHREKTSATASASGGSAITDVVGLAWGGGWRISSSGQLLSWRLYHEIEKTLFSEGTSVTHHVSGLEFSLSWGD